MVGIGSGLRSVALRFLLAQSAEGDGSERANGSDPITTEWPSPPNAAAATGFEAAVRKGVGERLNPAPCETAPCPTTTLWIGVVERERDYELTVRLSAAGGEPIESTVRCAICTPSEAGAKAAEAAIALLEDGHAWVRVSSIPANASIAVDGTEMGRTPARLEVEPGPHRVTIRADGYLPMTREISPGAGVEDAINVELLRDRSRRHRAMRIAGWTLVGTGVGALIGGITLLAMDERPVKGNCDGVHVDASGNCEFRWNTAGAGAGLLVTGIVVAAAGGTMVAIAKRRDGRDRQGVATRVRFGLDGRIHF